MGERIGYIYSITSPTGKTYVGFRKSHEWDENYWSHSKNPIFWEDLKKYGKDNFIRELLDWVYSDEVAQDKENYYILTLCGLEKSGGYNLCIWKNQHVNYPRHKQTEETRRKISEKAKRSYATTDRKERLKKSLSISLSKPEVRKKISNALKGRDFLSLYGAERKQLVLEKRTQSRRKNGVIPWNKNKKLSDAYKEKLSASHKGKYIGDKNPAYGKIWVSNYNTKIRKLVKKEELSKYIEDGYIKGMIRKFI